MAERSLWPALHDARVETVETDTVAGTVTLGLHIAHFNEFTGTSPRLRFVLTLVGVRIASVLRFVPSPNRVQPAYGAEAEKGLWESESWPIYAPALRKKQFEVIHPSLQESGEEITLTLEGLAQGKDRRSLRVMLVLTAACLNVARSDGAPFSLADLEALGAAYWDAWRARANAARER
jgi:hypothetical protein